MTDLLSKKIHKEDIGFASCERNPWAGLSSYDDPDTSRTPLIFCGRGKESYDVTQLIDDNLFVTLYGKSGTGKTSLLNAGVFPRLRAAHYLPISIRFSMDAIGMSLQACIIEKIRLAVKEKNYSEKELDVVPLPADELSEEYLWSFFARTRFTYTDKDSTYNIFPVLVFDQFEEVFRERKTEAEALLRQIYYMMDESHALTNRMVGDSLYTYDFNFRFVISIREDDLFSLEDCIDNNYLVSMKHCRYRLRSLSKESARDAIQIPGHGLFAKEDEEQVICTIIETSKNKENGEISTNLLSLICSRIYIYSRKTGSQLITAHLVNSYIAGNPFEKYYNEATFELSNKEKAYIEDHLIDSAGRRNSISESDFLLHVHNGEKLLDGPQKILQRVSAASGSKGNRIELIHDSFCAPLSALKQKRLLRRRRKMALACLTVAIFCIGIAIIIRFQLSHVERLNHTMQVNNARYVSEIANDLTSYGDSYTARQLALYVLNNRPYVIEAEAALRNASYHNSAILRGHQTPILSVSFSADGKQIMSQSADSTTITWNASNGMVLEKKKSPIATDNPFGKSADGSLYAQQTSDETVFDVHDLKNGIFIKTFDGHNGEVKAVCFSPDNKLIASASADNTIIIWNKDKEILETLKGHTNPVSCIAFSPDGKRLVSGANDNTVRIWDLQCVNMEHIQFDNRSQNSLWASCISHNGTLLASVPEYKEKIFIWDLSTGKTKFNFAVPEGIKCTTLSPDDKRIVCGYNNGEIRVFNVEDGHQVADWKAHQNNIIAISFSPDGKYFASSSSISHDSIKLWDANTYKLLHTFNDHLGKVNNIAFDKKSKILASVSDDKTIKIWDCVSGKCLKTFAGHNDAVTSAAFSSSGQQIVSTSNDNTIRIWDVTSGNQTRMFEGHMKRIKAVSFYKKDSLIVSAANDQMMVWDISSGVALSKMKGRSKTLSSLFINPSDNRNCVAYNDGICEKWSYRSLQQLIDATQKQFGGVVLSDEKLKEYYLE